VDLVQRQAEPTAAAGRRADVGQPLRLSAVIGAPAKPTATKLQRGILGMSRFSQLAMA
jgi:hypothetical protein